MPISKDYRSYIWAIALGLLAAGCTIKSDDEPDLDRDSTEQPQGRTDYPVAIDRDIKSDTVLEDTAAPPGVADYIVKKDLVSVLAKLTINPGVVIEFEEDTGMVVRKEGAIVAEGTAEKGIVLRGEQRDAGFWRGIIVVSQSADNAFDYVEVSDAGGGGYDAEGVFNRCNLAIGNSNKVPGFLKVSNSGFRNSAGYGIIAYAFADLSGFAKNTFATNADVPLVVVFSQALNLDNASSFKGMNGSGQKDYVQVLNTELSVGGTMAKLDVPYRFTIGDFALVSAKVETSVTKPLVLEAGTRVELEQGYSWLVNGGGSLKAVGTVAEPIVFTHAKEGTYFEGIAFETTSADNALDYIDIGYGGGKVLV